MKGFFFFIIDDGGFYHIGKNKNKCVIDLESYNLILKLARKLEIRIPICFTVKYLDKENISGLASPLPYIDDLMELLAKNKAHIEIGYHGLVHDNDGCIGEFFDLKKNEQVAEKIQSKNIGLSSKIFDYWDLDFPKLFVPPYNKWQIGVTDKILSDYGVKYLVSNYDGGYREGKWSIESSYLKAMPRSYLGLKSYQYRLNYLNFQYAKLFLIPRNPLLNLILNKTPRDELIHSYMTHIGNFTTHSSKFWKDISNHIINRNIYICKDNIDAINHYENALLQDKNFY
jgi:hypothetical protein